MAVVEVQKINIIAHDNFKKQILELLYDRGFMEIIPSSREGEEQNIVKQTPKVNIEYELAKVKYTLDFLIPYFKDGKSFINRITQERPQINLVEINKLRNKFNYIKISEIAENSGQRLNSIKSLISKLEEEKKLLLPWEELKLIIKSDLETVGTKALLGCIDKKRYVDFKNFFVNKFKEIAIDKINENENNTYLLFIFIKKYEKDILPILNSQEFKIAELPLLDITPKERLNQIERGLREIQGEITLIEEQASQLSRKHLKKLQIIFDFLTWKLEQEQIQENFSSTKSTFSVLGWIKRKEIANLKQEFKKITNTVEITTLPIGKDEPIPVAMENTSFLKPFEFVTNIYGFPKYQEVDPTPFLAGFFIVFFGLCLTDAGYGLALAVSTFLALKYLKVAGGFKKLLRVLFYGGIITFFAGILTGGWFGIVLEELPAGLNWLAKSLIAVRRIDPVKNPIVMLVISLILGYIHLLFGNAINLWWKIKHGEIKSGLVDSGVWMYFLLTVGFWLLTSQNIIAGSLADIALYLVYSAMALVILTQGKSKNLLIKILGGLSGLYFGITGYISDILSYSRLLALGLATGIIGMVINIIGMMLNEMIPYVGWLLMVLVLIGGHIFNMVISLVGAFIHSGRLQYVEFFKTFFEGGGKEFKPFARESKYIDLIK